MDPRFSSPQRSYETIIAGFKQLEAELGAPHGALVSLVTDDEHDDWSFVIRSHAIIEGAVSQMLASALDQRLRPVLDRLELGKADTGKLEFAKALGLLTEEQRKFIRLLSNLRNMLAHNLQYLDFTFAKHVARLDKQQKKAFFDSLIWIVPDEFKEAFRSVAEEAPRAVIAANIQAVVRHAVEHGSFAKISREEAESALQQVISGQLVPLNDTFEE